MSPSLSILHTLAYHLWTGPAEPVFRLAKAQQAAGHRVRLALDTYREDGELQAKVEQWGLDLHAGFCLSPKAGPILNMRDVLAFKRLFASEEFDFVHCHRSHDHSLAALARQRKTRVKLLRTLHTERAASPARRWQLKRADGLITVSRAVRDDLRSRVFLPPELIVAVEGAVDSRLFQPGRQGRLHRELGLPPGALLVGMVARMKEGRGHKTLLEAWAQVAGDFPQAHLLLAGRGELEEELRAHEAGPRVHFVGYRRDLPQFYPELHLKVMLAPGNDGTCRAALEAMASGVPLLAAQRGALAEIVEDGVDGALVVFGSVDALAKALRALLSAPERLAELGQKAAQKARERFTIEKQLHVIQGLMEGLVPA